ncbi:MAG: penicillin-binding protein 1B [Dokdonella sp.]
MQKSADYPGCIRYLPADWHRIALATPSPVAVRTASAGKLTAFQVWTRLNVRSIFWRLLRNLILIGIGFGIVFGIPYTLWLDYQVRARFDDLRWQAPTRVYARPLELRDGLPMNAEALQAELDAARYRKLIGASSPGSYERDGSRYTLARREFIGLDGRNRSRRVSLTISNGRVSALLDADSGAAISTIALDPARIATLYGAAQEERRVVDVGQLPPLLVAGLQAVEDRDFKDHHGLDSRAILRAAWNNLRARRVVQGGSTLTQQLVRNLYLNRDQTFLRKANEALMALIIEARYDKRRILDAYVNEVFLGQQGGQAVHGFAAASEFWFGRDIGSVGPAEIAMLVGLVQGPSYYDPRRAPERALARRNLVLDQFRDTGLIDNAIWKQARASALGVIAEGALPRNRYPAFLDLVRQQLTNDYPADMLNGAGLSVLTTLSPSAQNFAESAIDRALAALGKRGSSIEAAAVVTGARDGEVQALIGGRDPDQPGFNRALTALRPIGSLIKPFAYLVALAQPQRYSLASIINDDPINMKQPDGSRWTPKNSDGEVHGPVLLIDALVNSWNLASIDLGLRVGVDRVRGMLESFDLKRTINPNPSLLLGAVDLSPFDVAQLYQYLAADGRALPLNSVRGVLDGQGRPLARYGVKQGNGSYVTAARLITYALQLVTRSGTAREVAAAGLDGLNAAGKTGTSDSQRDSWFAGYTGGQLAVVWLGRDDNKPTGLFGSTGALKVWIELFRRLPSQPLTVPQDGIETALVDPASGKATDAQCSGARQLPFAVGYTPQEQQGCPLDKLKNFFGTTTNDTEQN